MKRLPNIIVTGVPGVGKTTLCEELVSLINKELIGIKEDTNVEKNTREAIKEATEVLAMVHLNLSKVIKEERLYEEYDDELDATIYDEDMVNEKLTSLEVEKGGFIFDFHDINFIIHKKKIIDHIFLLTASTNSLYDRLEKRNYTQEKIKNNIECEIFQTIKEDILEHFDDPTIFHELENNTLQQHEHNLDFVKKWVLANVRGVEKSG
ncbi:hemoglobin and proliferation regulated protein HBR1 [Plasmodium ovale wallikeri]|uniref:Adenylate kinase isoenzyme 6 homolog n=2 Tax=Plasmodium ovale TaxID=36330 RepID=A0A1A8YGC9_PLAOA|nr:hemoglobin and proliferation regulated protein HBR1 [Plasmodium ovale wallikeri]SBT31210.1 hemoglobin and proliferation regulated protein HBR1 [Plasmodium ovale wallikeri]SBT75267.1 adenylate kinase-like protein 1, putative [Plasmodium ovale]